jgi:hypothetical protein
MESLLDNIIFYPLWLPYVAFFVFLGIAVIVGFRINPHTVDHRRWLVMELVWLFLAGVGLVSALLDVRDVTEWRVATAKDRVETRREQIVQEVSSCQQFFKLLENNYPGWVPESRPDIPAYQATGKWCDDIQAQLPVLPASATDEQEEEYERQWRSGSSQRAAIQDLLTTVPPQAPVNPRPAGEFVDQVRAAFARLNPAEQSLAQVESHGRLSGIESFLVIFGPFIIAFVTAAPASKLILDYRRGIEPVEKEQEITAQCTLE